MVNNTLSLKVAMFGTLAMFLKGFMGAMMQGKNRFKAGSRPPEDKKFTKEK